MGDGMMEDGLFSTAEFRRHTRELLSAAGYSTREQILEMLREIRREIMEELYGSSPLNAGKTEDKVIVELKIFK